MVKKYSFAKKQNRDAKARSLKAQGFNIKKSSHRNQLCDPRYMEDYNESMGNDYQTWFSAIYIVEAN